MSPTLKTRLLRSASVALALTFPAVVGAQAPIGDVSTADATVKGSVQTVATGTRVMSGSSISAGATTAAIRLLRGGEVRVCPRSTISLSSSASGRDLAISIGTGGIETHYRVRTSSADTVMTPDFRILLAGPGSFDVAISADARGNTCVRSSAGASIVVSEIMGDGTYQVQGGDQVYFRNGSVANPTNAVPPDCGCPPPVPVSSANSQPALQPAPVPPAQTGPAAQTPATPQNQPAAQPTKVPASSPEAVFAEHGQPVTTTPTPSAGGASQSAAVEPKQQDKEIHVQLETPFVFRGDDPQNVPPPPQVAQLRLVYLPKLIAETQVTTALPPPDKKANQKKEKAAKAGQQGDAPKKGFFGHVKSFFGSIFK